MSLAIRSRCCAWGREGGGSGRERGRKGAEEEREGKRAVKRVGGGRSEQSKMLRAAEEEKEGARVAGGDRSAEEDQQGPV